MDFSHVGKRANSVKGSAKAKANPNIPIAGARMEPVVETSTNRKPMIGPVQENETSVKVNAIRKMLSMPLVLSYLESTALLHDEGKVISNAPKNEAANTTNIRKNRMLNIALVDSAFNALAPNIKVMDRPNIK